MNSFFCSMTDLRLCEPSRWHLGKYFVSQSDKEAWNNGRKPETKQSKLFYQAVEDVGSVLTLSCIERSLKNYEDMNDGYKSVYNWILMGLSCIERRTGLKNLFNIHYARKIQLIMLFASFHISLCEERRMSNRLLRLSATACMTKEIDERFLSSFPCSSCTLYGMSYDFFFRFIIYYLIDVNSHFS